MEPHVEQLGEGVLLCVSKAHRFGTDSFLLSDFALPRRGQLVCDLGTGCGIVPMLWFREQCGPQRVWAVDIQQEAIELLERSVKLSGLEERLRPVWADLRALPMVLPKAFADLVTCNPPYYPVGTGRTSSAESDCTSRHETLCTLDEVCSAANGLLKYGGRLCICLPPARLVDAMTAMRKHGMEPKRLRMVHQRAKDAPWLVLLEGKRGAKPSLRVLAPLLMREDERASDEMNRIYRLYGKL